MAVKIVDKVPNADLDYPFDWSDWLATGEVISARTITIETIDDDVSPLVLASTENDNSVVTAWLEDGTAGNAYTVTCQIVTDNAKPRTDERSVEIRMLPIR